MDPAVSVLHVKCLTVKGAHNGGPLTLFPRVATVPHVAFHTNCSASSSYKTPTALSVKPQKDIPIIVSDFFTSPISPVVLTTIGFPNF